MYGFVKVCCLFWFGKMLLYFVKLVLGGGIIFCRVMKGWIWSFVIIKVMFFRYFFVRVFIIVI